MNKWTVLSGGAIVALLLLQPLLFSNVLPDMLPKIGASGSKKDALAPELQYMNLLRATAWSTPFLLLFVLNLVCLFWFIVPIL